MNFSFLFLIFFIFVLIPELIKRLNLNNVIDERAQKWLDINQLLDLAFSKVPKFQYSNQVSLILGVIFTYFSLNSDSTFSLVSYLLSLVFFVHLAYLNSDDLLDTFSNKIITFIAFYVFYNLLTSCINYFLIETDWTIIFKNRRYILLGPYFINSETGDEVWRFWPPLYTLLILAIDKSSLNSFPFNSSEEL